MRLRGRSFADYNDAPEMDAAEGDMVDEAPEPDLAADAADAEPEEAVVKITTKFLTKYERGTF